MPAFIKTPKDEELWARAKSAVTRNEHIPEAKFQDRHWAKVNALYQIINKKKNGRNIKGK